MLLIQLTGLSGAGKTTVADVTKRELEKEDEKNHTDYEYTIEYKCADISKVTQLDVNIFRDIETLKEVVVQLVTDKTQKELKLGPTNSKIELK